MTRIGDGDTICALSSAPGRGGVAVIRVSGPEAGRALEMLSGDLPKPRMAALRTFRRPHTAGVLDAGLAIWFPRPSSFTGEDTAELHVHGGRAVVASILEVLRDDCRCRLAEPGEFARRAFENGKIDLTAAEGLADLIDAETEAQRLQAVRQAGGALQRMYDGWRSDVISALALVEAAIDFSDEGDVTTDAVMRAENIVRQMEQEIASHLADGRRGEILRDGFHVVIAGAPNTGKSSLLNALAQRDAAIVSPEAGTTRDVIEVRLDLEGLPIILSDTAGIRPTEGDIEQEGIRRTIARGREADLILWLTDARVPERSLPPEWVVRDEQVLVVLNKIDLLGDGREASLPPAAVGISARSGAGLGALMSRLADIARARIGLDEGAAITQQRHRMVLEDCRASLLEFQDTGIKDVELRAEDLRRASQALGRLTGRVDAEDVLGQIFSRFCIGK